MHNSVNLSIAKEKSKAAVFVNFCQFFLKENKIGEGSCFIFYIKVVKYAKCIQNLILNKCKNSFGARVIFVPGRINLPTNSGVLVILISVNFFSFCILY